MDFRTTQMAEVHLLLKSIIPTRFIGLNSKLKTLYIFKSKVPIVTQSIGNFCVAPHQLKFTTTTQPCGQESYRFKRGHVHFGAFKEDNNLVLAKKGSSSLAIDDHEKDGNARMSTKLRKKRRESPEGLLRYGLDMCSKRGDLVEALRLYDKALEGGAKFDQYNYNVLLYLCSSAAMGDLRPAKSGSERNPGRIKPSPELLIDETTNKDTDVLEDNTCIKFTKEMQALALRRGSEIYEKLCLEKVPLNEATFTSVARLAAAKGDGDLAFNMVKQMAANDITPRLRSYSPALFTFCKNMEAEKAYEVDCHMRASGVEAEEPELAGLLKLSVESGRESKVYSLLHRLRTSVRQVNPSTANVIERWFKSKVAAHVGTSWNANVIRNMIESRGGGWHGLGWMNTGKWRVEHTTMTPKGVCRCCGEQLVTIDIDPMETERFAKSVAELASQRERKSNFTSFQEWLDDHGPYEVIIDGANVGLYRQNSYGDGFFSLLNAVVNGIRERSPSKRWPLVILHNKRTREGPAKLPQNKQLMNIWKKVGALYTTPAGSNDDWYWLYAAVKFKCLIVTVDEMRDHLFSMLGNDFFPKWKERHQVRFTFIKYGPEFYMPPPYSIVIQESEQGSWHIPIVGGDDIEILRKWLCITRPEKKWHPSQAFQTGSQLDSKLRKIKDVHDAVSGQSDVASDKIKVPRAVKKNEKDLSDLYTESAPVIAEVSAQKNRPSLSSHFKSKKKRQPNSPSEPPSSPASVTLKQIEAAEKDVDFVIDFQI